MNTDIKETQRQSAWQAFASSLGYTEPVSLRPNVLLGLAASAAAVTILLLASGMDTEMAVFWTFGLLFGFVLQRSRFCFASAFRDIFLLRHGRSMKGVLAGLAVAIPAFAILMSKQVANPSLGILPPDANVLPLGIHTVVGGLLFGAGMVIAGGCVSGSIYRMGEGYVASWVSFGGIMLGLLMAAFTWNWWWHFSIKDGARLWLPAYLGYGGALAVTLTGLLAVYLLILWWESRGGLVIPEMPFVPEDGDTFAAKLSNSFRRFFRAGWPILVGGATLGGLNALLFYYAHPWGFTGEISRWVIGASNAAGAGPGILEGAANLPGCALELGDSGVLSHMLFLVLGMVFGSFIAALFAGEFKIRIPRQIVRYAQASGGGVIMGYGAGIAMGCTIGAFFSAIPSLAVNGWVFAIALAAGAWIGTKVITRL
jgi:uncharacterized membrane protein YedE/YeeE